VGTSSTAAAIKITMGPGRVGGWLRRLAEPAGASVTDDPAEADALIWTDTHDVDGLRAALATGPGIRWVQLPSAGVEETVAAGAMAGNGTGAGRVWTAAKGVYGEPVAEHALALLLAGLRQLDERVGASTWGERSGRTLFDSRVTIVGAGGIAEALTRLLAPFRVQVTLVGREGREASGTSEGNEASGASGAMSATPILGRDRLHEALADADAVVLALALTPATAGIIAEPELRAMKDDAWLVNVARGRHIVTADLLTALHEGWIGGAALDVTDPEPLPDDHPLWRAPHCIITPHSACPHSLAVPRLGARIAENIRRFVAGEELLGIVDLTHGY
jgi:phosphoglycerate dehydrogenase-like enzyme